MKHISEYFPEALAPAIRELIQKQSEEAKPQPEPADQAEAERIEAGEGE